VNAIHHAYTQAAHTASGPTLIVAKTEKGHGVSFVANKEGWHGKAFNAAQAKEAIAELGGERHLLVKPKAPAPATPDVHTAGTPALPNYAVGDKVATRKAYGDALKALGAARDDVVVLDAEVSNSTFADIFGHAYPDRFFEMYIAEQQLVAAAVGMQVRQYVPFASTFAAFFSRAYDFIRMTAVSRGNIRLCGSHAGVSIGADGPSQMALEDLAMMRAVHGSTVLYPSDANQTAHLVNLMANQTGISYLRTTREATPVLYTPDAPVHIGGSNTVRQSSSDQVAIVGAGITLHEAVKAHAQLAAAGINVRVIDCYSVKPIDTATLVTAVRECQHRLVVVEDHWPEGGIAEAVLSAISSQGLDPQVARLAVNQMVGSGTPEELMGQVGIDAAAIVAAVHGLLGK
jgi:transketolase